MRQVIIGIDLGGTNLRIGAVMGDNTLEHPHIISSSIIAEADAPLKKLGQIIEEYIEEYRFCSLKAVSIGVPSSVASDRETVICTTNLKNAAGEAVFSHTNIAVELRERLKAPVFVNNDTNNILRYDVFCNHLETEAVVAGIYIGTGVGASVLVDGRSLRGANGAALDIGHLPFYMGSEPCSCGKRGCCECYASGWRLMHLREKYYPETDIAKLFLQHKEDKPLREFLYSCAHIYSVMATIFNPDSMIVGGGVMEMEGFPREEFERLVNENTGRDVMSYGFKYIYSEDFAMKGVIGAAIYARKVMDGNG